MPPPPPTTYSCVDGSCVADPGGIYTDPTCEGACGSPPPPPPGCSCCGHSCCCPPCCGDDFRCLGVAFCITIAGAASTFLNGTWELFNSGGGCCGAWSYQTSTSSDDCPVELSCGSPSICDDCGPFGGGRIGGVPCAPCPGPFANQISFYMYCPGDGTFTLQIGEEITGDPACNPFTLYGCGQYFTATPSSCTSLLSMTFTPIAGASCLPNGGCPWYIEGTTITADEGPCIGIASVTGATATKKKREVRPMNITREVTPADEPKKKGGCGCGSKKSSPSFYKEDSLSTLSVAGDGYRPALPGRLWYARRQEEIARVEKLKRDAIRAKVSR